MCSGLSQQQGGILAQLVLKCSIAISNLDIYAAE